MQGPDPLHWPYDCAIKILLVAQGRLFNLLGLVQRAVEIYNQESLLLVFFPPFISSEGGFFPLSKRRMGTFVIV